MQAYELTGSFDKKGKLHLDRPLPIRNHKVKVIVMLDEGNEIDDLLWMKATKDNPVFDFLNDPEEDIYTINDGKPYAG